MNYLINESQNWADEFEVQFYEILTDEEYQKYMYCKEKLKQFNGSLYFGTNEGWDDDFDFLDFTLIPITDTESDILRKYFPKYSETVYDQFMENIDEIAYEQLGYYISNLSIDGFKNEFDKLDI